MTGRRALVAALLLVTGCVAAGCGITPTGVVDVAGPPTVRIPPPSKTIYLLKDDELALEPADVENDTVDSLLTALFQASDLHLVGRYTALRGFTYEGIQDSLNPIQRDEVKLPRTSTLTVYIKGVGTLPKMAKAQIVCTAQQDAAYEQVKIIRQYTRRAPRSEGQYTCGDLK